VPSLLFPSSPSPLRWHMWLVSLLLIPPEAQLLMFVPFSLCDEFFTHSFLPQVPHCYIATIWPEQATPCNIYLLAEKTVQSVLLSSCSPHTCGLLRALALANAVNITKKLLFHRSHSAPIRGELKKEGERIWKSKPRNINEMAFWIHKTSSSFLQTASRLRRRIAMVASVQG
jgi:hypothetical protein